MKETDIFVTCHPHIGPILAKEIERLGFPVLEEGIKGVLTQGDYSDTMKLNLWLRSANKVLYKIADFEATEPGELYKRTFKIDWENIIPDQGYLSIDSSIKNDSIRDNRFANLKLKDAIVDRIRKKTERRPDTGPYKDRTVIFLFWHKNQARIYLDTSGETISKHGYRKNPYKAPMIESLAAATIMASNWNQSVPFVNPMCGSGTLAIEAALMVQNKAPGLFRNNFGFMHTKLFSEDQWKSIRDEASKQVKKNADIKIVATDISVEAILAAKMNAKNAEVDHLIEFEKCDFRETTIPAEEGMIILNPEYGERIGELDELEDTYRDIGDFFKTNCAGHTGFIFTGNLDLAKRVGLKASSRTIFFNGKIECRLLKYELYKGTKRTK
ncbi:MAG: class I SAM-dependent RNA methyltransferase [Bacteroidetes bacterium]|nr:class I SAM-dependent RNA methyltransferase [Bacteroidota bacterium]